MTVIDSLNRLIRIDYHVIPQISIYPIRENMYIYFDSFGSHRQPLLDCYLDIVISWDLGCKPLEWLLVVNKRWAYNINTKDIWVSVVVDR